MPKTARTLTCGRASLATLPFLVGGLLTSAAASELVWQTKISLSVVQWLPMEGQYRQVDALSGEFEISQDGQLNLPVLGTVPIGEDDPNALAHHIAARFQEKLGLLQVPDVRVQVVGQRPIYVVGTVEDPGEKAFRPGITVLQALALGGGPLRTNEQPQEERISLLSSSTTLQNDIHSSLARLARYEAEAAGAEEIIFPAELNVDLSASLMLQERKIFTLRVGGLQRQQSALVELKELYQAEVEVLRSRVITLDQRITTAEADIERITTLFQKGLATVSQRNDLEMMLGDLRSDRLDHLTAQMRAQQLISQADRDLTSLEDNRQSEVAESLLAERATLARLKVEQVETARLLEELDRKLMMGSATAPGSKTQIRYNIIRSGEAIGATEESPLEPGDVVKVTLEANGVAAPVLAEVDLAALPVR